MHFPGCKKVPLSDFSNFCQEKKIELRAKEIRWCGKEYFFPRCQNRISKLASDVVLLRKKPHKVFSSLSWAGKDSFVFSSLSNQRILNFFLLLLKENVWNGWIWKQVHFIPLPLFQHYISCLILSLSLSFSPFLSFTLFFSLFYVSLDLTCFHFISSSISVSFKKCLLLCKVISSVLFCYFCALVSQRFSWDHCLVKHIQSFVIFIFELSDGSCVLTGPILVIWIVR